MALYTREQIYISTKYSLSKSKAKSKSKTKFKDIILFLKQTKYSRTTKIYKTTTKN